MKISQIHDVCSPNKLPLFSSNQCISEQIKIAEEMYKQLMQKQKQTEEITLVELDQGFEHFKDWKEYFPKYNLKQVMTDIQKNIESKTREKKNSKQQQH